MFGSLRDGVSRVSANGGDPELIRPPPESDPADVPRWLDVLPDGQAALATVGRIPNTEIVVLDLTTGEQEPLLTGTSPRYVSTGHLVYWRDESIWAVPFDAGRREVTGPPVPVVEDVGVNLTNDWASFAVGGDTLVYEPLLTGISNKQLVWVDLDGSEQAVGSRVGDYSGLALSPDGQRAIVEVPGDLQIYDLARDSPTRLTFDAGNDRVAIWSLDAERVLFSSTRDGSVNVFARAANGTGEAEPLTSGETAKYPGDWSPDGTMVLLSEFRDTFDITALLMDGEQSIEPLVETEFREWLPKVSPNGRWMAYTSTESGQEEVYVVPFPNTSDGKWLMSREGGTWPVWSRDGSELFYVGPENMMAVPITAESTFSYGTPDALFGVQNFHIGLEQPYDVAPDGRFLMIRLHSGASRLVIVENWTEELTRLVPTE